MHKRRRRFWSACDVCFKVLIRFFLDHYGYGGYRNGNGKLSDGYCFEDQTADIEW